MSDPGPDASWIERTAAVLLHGLCSTPDELRMVETRLRALGYTTDEARIDGYSFDAGAAVQRSRPFASWVDAIERRVDALRARHDRVVLIGISAGASLALAGAIRCGRRVDALVLMSTSLKLDGWSIPRFHFLLPLALYTPLGRLWKYRERPPYGIKNERIRAWIERELQTRRISSAGASVIGVDHLRENDRLIRQVRARLPEVGCGAVLALHAREDEVASPRNLGLLARGLTACRRFRAVVLEDCFHMISVDNSRHRVVKETVDFIQSIQETPAS